MQVNCACRVPNASGGFPHGLSFLSTKIWQLWVTLMMIAPEGTLSKMLFSIFFFSSLVLWHESSLRTEWSWDAWLGFLAVALQLLTNYAATIKQKDWPIKDWVEMSLGNMGKGLIQIFLFCEFKSVLIIIQLPWLLYIWMNFCFKLLLRYWFKNKVLLDIRSSVHGGSCLKCLDFSHSLNVPFTFNAFMWWPTVFTLISLLPFTTLLQQ